MKEIKTIVIDWHGVCDHVTFESFVRLLAGEKVMTIDEVKGKIKNLANDWIIGKIEPDVFWGELAVLFGLGDDSILKLKSYILSTETNSNVMLALQKLKNDGYRIVLLSDCPKDKKDLIVKTPFAQIFEGMFFSCDAFMSKENHDFFINVLHDCGIESDECLYVDDNKKHIDTAEFLSFNTLLFSGDTIGLVKTIKNKVLAKS